VRRLVPALLLLPLVAACGGGGGAKKPTSTTTKAADPGKAAIAALFQAAVHDDRKGLWNLLSTPSQRRLGGFDTFTAHGAVAIEHALRPFESASLTPFISQSVSQQFGLVAIRNGTRALAFPLRRQKGALKIETPGPLTFQILGPQPGSSGAVSQIGVEVHSPGVVGDAIVFVDGRALRPTLAPAQGTATVFATLAKPLAAGVHIAVVYAEEGSDASAEAWTFTAG
jgi:hypothetical protein